MILFKSRRVFTEMECGSSCVLVTWFLKGLKSIQREGSTLASHYVHEGSNSPLIHLKRGIIILCCYEVAVVQSPI